MHIWWGRLRDGEEVLKDVVVYSQKEQGTSIQRYIQKVAKVS